MATAQYCKRCFDKIEPIVAENKDLKAEVERLRRQLEVTEQEKTVREAQNQNIIIQLRQKEREKTRKPTCPHFRALNAMSWSARGDKHVCACSVVRGDGASLGRSHASRHRECPVGQWPEATGGAVNEAYRGIKE